MWGGRKLWESDKENAGETNVDRVTLVRLLVQIHLWVDASSPVTRMFSSSWYREGILLMEMYGLFLDRKEVVRGPFLYLLFSSCLQLK